MEYQSEFICTLVFSRELSGVEVLKFQHLKNFKIKSDAKSIILNNFSEMNLSDLEINLHELTLFVKNINSNNENITINGIITEEIYIGSKYTFISEFTYDSVNYQFKRKILI